jgi:hypothetical protein
LHGFDVRLTGEPQDVERVFAGNGHELTAVGPVDLLRLNLDPANETTGRPVEERDTALTSHTQEDTTSKPVSLEADIEPSALLHKVLVHLDAHGRLPDGKVIAVVLGCPHKVERRAECLVAPCKSSVNDVLAVAAY